MDFPIYLAHGALGIWDEVVFASVAFLFLVFMGISWVRSNTADAPDEPIKPTSETTPNETDERFQLD